MEGEGKVVIKSLDVPFEVIGSGDFLPLHPNLSARDAVLSAAVSISEFHDKAPAGYGTGEYSLFCNWCPALTLETLRAKKR